MRVHEYGTVRYLVKSSDMEHRYLVDLCSLGGKGQCDCPHGRFTHGPMAQRNDPETDKHRCRHIKEARLKLSRWLVRQLAGQDLLTGTCEGFELSLEDAICSCGKDACEHLFTFREHLVTSYISKVVKEHGNVEGH